MDISIAEYSRKKMKIGNEAEETLPEHLILWTILPRLPVKSALRLQLVSKQWHAFIKHPLFTRLHLSITKKRNPNNFLILTRQPYPYPLIPKLIAADGKAKTLEAGGSSYAPLAQVKIGRDDRYVVADIIGVCSGVLCVAYGTDAVLWNPAIREVKVVEYSYGEVELNILWHKLSYIGFGSMKDGCGNVVNFKLLMMVDDYEYRGRLFLICSLNTGKWRLLESPSFGVNLVVRDGWVNLNGVLHWIAWGDHTKDSAFVLTFDIVSETFGRIELPRTNEPLVWREFENLLTVFEDQYLSLAVPVDVAGAIWLDIWVLFSNGNKKSWMRAGQMIGPFRITGKMLGYWDGIGVMAHDGGRLWLHAEGNDTKRETGLYGTMKCLEYVETYVSPRRISDQDDFQGID